MKRLTERLNVNIDEADCGGDTGGRVPTFCSRMILPLVMATLLLWPGAAEARRVALVVGIGYETAASPRLPNAARDGDDMAAALGAAGFDVVRPRGGGLAALQDALEQFYAQAEGATAALFYFAGHGIQFDSINYLVPDDAQLRSETRLKQETIALQDVITSLERRNVMTLIFLDACRNNPLAEALQRKSAGTGRSAVVSRGLAPMTVRNPDTLLVFAAAPGKEASDGTGSNSPFTTAMLRNLAEPGVEIELMMKRVTRDVVQETGGEQVPERLSRLTSEFVFKQAPGGTIRHEASAPPAPASPPPVASGVPAPKRNDCLVLGARLDRPVQVAVGTRVCSRDGEIRATIESITSYTIVYAARGRRWTCRRTEICTFWDGGPNFGLGRSETGQGRIPSAELVPG